MDQISAQFLCQRHHKIPLSHTLSHGGPPPQFLVSQWSLASGYFQSYRFYAWEKGSTAIRSVPEPVWGETTAGSAHPHFGSHSLISDIKQLSDINTHKWLTWNIYTLTTCTVLPSLQRPKYGDSKASGCPGLWFCQFERKHDTARRPPCHF